MCAIYSTAQGKQKLYKGPIKGMNTWVCVSHHSLKLCNLFSFLLFVLLLHIEFFFICVGNPDCRLKLIQVPALSQPICGKPESNSLMRSDFVNDQPAKVISSARWSLTPSKTISSHQTIPSVHARTNYKKQYNYIVAFGYCYLLRKANPYQLDIRSISS